MSWFGRAGVVTTRSIFVHCDRDSRFFSQTLSKPINQTFISNVNLSNGSVGNCQGRTFSSLSRRRGQNVVPWPPVRPSLGPNCPTPRSSNVIKAEAPVRTFRTSGRQQIHPAIILLIKPFAKVASILSGRTLRRLYQQLPEAQKQVWNKRMRRAAPIVIGTGVGLLGVNYYMHIQETPITKRKRYVAVTPDQFLKISQFEYTMHLENLKDQILPNTHPYYQRVKRVGMRLINANQDIEFFKKQNWTVILVDDPERNAFVLPTGQIFVNTGLMNIVLNDDQLATVIGHEMSHALLSHGAERMSIAGLLDSVTILILGFLWFWVPSDGIAVVTHWFFNKVTQILLNLPYDRKLEAEADEVGLYLLAKACYDVRESSNFWDLMRFVREAENPEAADIPEIFSTHPSNDSRMAELNRMIPQALDVRDLCKCPRLGGKDPRAVLQEMKAIIKSAVEKSRQEAEAEAQKALPPVVGQPQTV